MVAHTQYIYIITILELDQLCILKNKSWKIFSFLNISVVNTKPDI